MTKSVQSFRGNKTLASLEMRAVEMKNGRKHRKNHTLKHSVLFLRINRNVALLSDNQKEAIVKNINLTNLKKRSFKSFKLFYQSCLNKYFFQFV